MGRQFFCHSATRPNLDQGRFHGIYCKTGCTMECCKTPTFCYHPALHQFQLDLHSKSVTFPPEKIIKLHQLLRGWFVNNSRFMYTETAKLHGKLVYASLIFPLVWPFICSAATFTSKFTCCQARLAQILLFYSEERKSA